jgi:hypothetical protein
MVKLTREESFFCIRVSVALPTDLFEAESKSTPVTLPFLCAEAVKPISISNSVKDIRLIAFDLQLRKYSELQRKMVKEGGFIVK